MSSRLTIVLVHGAFANAGCWSKLIPLLVAKGFSVTASNCPLSTLADDVDTVRQTIKMQDGPMLLVGHSWGGAVITEAGNEPLGLRPLERFAIVAKIPSCGLTVKFPGDLDPIPVRAAVPGFGLRF